MSRLAMDQITITDITDGENGVSVKIVTPFYALGTSAPDKPTTNPPASIWTATEPGYVKGKNLYKTQRTVLEDSTFSYSDVSLDSSYKASEQAITTSDTANTTANKANTTAVQAMFAALPSLADKTQANSWFCAIFPTGTSSVQTLPSYSLIASLSASDTKYSADSGDILRGSGIDYHYGLIRTLVSFSADKTWTFTYSHDDGSRIYVDGVNVFENARYTIDDPVTINFTKGNHIVDVMYANGEVNYGVWGFSVALSSIATAMYAPAGASVLAETYSTKSYADQTAKSISLGVVEEYKNGQHGSALATQSDISIAKDFITSTVSQTYATKIALDSTNENVSNAQNVASQALANARELVANGGFETGDATRWYINGAYQVVDDMASAHSGRYYLNAGYAIDIVQPISVPVIPGHTYRFSGWYRRPSTNSSIIGGIRFQKSSDGNTYNDWQMTDFDTSKQDDWTYFSIDGTIPSDGSVKYARYRLAFVNTTGVVQHFDDLSFKDITEVAQLQSDVAATYATQSSVQQTATEITSKVSETYATSSALSDTNENVSNAQNVASQALANAKELIVNGGFESVGIGPWYINAAYQVVDDMASAHSGRYYLNAGSATEISQPISVPVIPGHTYRFSGWYRRPSTNSSIIGGIRFQKSSDGNTYNDWQMTDFDTSKQDDWTYFSIDGTIPSDGSVKYARYRLAFVNTTGVVQHFDDLSFKDITDYTELSSTVKQTATEWGVNLNQLSTALLGDGTANNTGELGNIRDTIDSQSDSINKVSDKMDDEITQRQAYMNFTQDDNGNPLLELGASQNTNKVDITNEKVSFKSEGSEVAYISNKELHINNATIVQKLIIGNQIGFIPRADGHLTLTRI